MLAAYARIPARFSVLIRRLRSKPLIRWEFGRSLSYPRGFIDFDSFPGPVLARLGRYFRVDKKFFSRIRRIEGARL